MPGYGVFLGCLIPFRYPCVEVAIRKVFDALGADYGFLPDYTCCPEPVFTRLVDPDFWLTLAARNLALAEEQGFDKLVVPCCGCYESLREAEEALREPEVREKVNSALSEIGHEYKGRVEVESMVETLYRDFLPKLRELAQRPFRARVAIHYCCHLFRTRPGEDIWLKHDMTKELLRAAGAEVIHYKLERFCCGFPAFQVDPEFSLKERLAPKLEAMRAVGADCVVTFCMACITQFERGQTMLRRYGYRFNLPVLHLMEVLALALGVKPEELGLEVHRSPVPKLVAMIYR
ncbi:CoB--CoM heterodisulfide reductase subunit B [Candidatus Bathyarchaeota archaeon]|nr:MAG: CoB--CoM heterodisulfide reductase subunit B [Candidatus Bathyarchaeota archaeon]